MLFAAKNVTHFRCLLFDFWKIREYLNFVPLLQQHITECFCRANSLLPRTKTNL